MRTGAKTVHVDERPSFAGSLVTIFAGQGARAAESKTLRDTLPGKSRVGRILLNDNHSQSRLLDMKLADIQQMRRKAEVFISHQQKTFIAKMEKRQDTWVREHSRFSSSTNLVMPPEELRQEEDKEEALLAGRETTNSQLLLDGALGRKSSKSAPHDGKVSDERRHSGLLPAITYLTEDAENSPREPANRQENMFVKEPDEHDRRPVMFVGLPPITQAKRSGFQPSGNIDELFDDRDLRKKKTMWPPIAEAAGVEDASANRGNDPTDPAAPGRESKISAIEDIEVEEPACDCGPSPALVLSRTLPLIQIPEQTTRKLRPSRVQQPKMQRKRSRHRSATLGDSENPLVDERFLKLHQLLASEVVIDHESRELSALARGMLAAKRFGRGRKRDDNPASTF